MVSKLRLCRATQFARASASATVVIASTSTASCSPKIKVDVIGSKPSASPKGLWPLADHSLSRGGKNVHTKRVRRDRRGHASGLIQSICAVHLVPLFMSERVTVQETISRSATLNLLDERIDCHQTLDRKHGERLERTLL